MKRPWLDLHPKITAALVTFVALLGVVYVASLVGIDLKDGVEKWVVSSLPILAGYLKTSDE